MQDDNPKDTTKATEKNNNKLLLSPCEAHIRLATWRQHVWGLGGNESDPLCMSVPDVKQLLLKGGNYWT